MKKNASRESTVCYFYGTGARASPAHFQRWRTLNLNIQMPTRHRYDGFNDALSTTHFSERHLRYSPAGQGLDSIDFSSCFEAPICYCNLTSFFSHSHSQRLGRLLKKHINF